MIADLDEFLLTYKPLTVRQVLFWICERTVVYQIRLICDFFMQVFDECNELDSQEKYASHIASMSIKLYPVINTHFSAQKHAELSLWTDSSIIGHPLRGYSHYDHSHNSNHIFQYKAIHHPSLMLRVMVHWGHHIEGSRAVVANASCAKFLHVVNRLRFRIAATQNLPFSNEWPWSNYS